MLENKKQLVNSTVDKLNDYYNFIHKTESEPKKLKKKIKDKVKKSLKIRIISFKRTKKREKTKL